MRKFAVFLAATAGCLLLVEGLLSLAWATSLRALFAPRLQEEEQPYQPTDQDRAAAAARSEGPFRVPDDALVAYTLKAASALTYTEGKVTMQLVTDELGLRARPGAPPPADALRIVVLGDSVAFGFGLDDADTLAAQLERLLAAPLGGRVACYTVAVPSWNARNAWRFLLDHLAFLRPDIVLYLPVDNDLEDSYGVTEAGQRRAAEDPASPNPLLHVRPVRALVTLRTRELRATGDDPEARLGPGVIGARLSPLSRQRYADMARTIQAGIARLERTNARCALVSYEQSEFHRELRAELLRAGAAPVEIPLFEELEKNDTLGIDPHPSAATVGVFALWIAESLFELGWLPGAARASLPAAGEAYAGRRARALAGAEAEAWSRARRVRLEGELQMRISTDTLQGILQVYGGLNLDGTLEAQCAVVLPRGRTLAVRLAPLAAPPDLYPLEVRVFANERALGSLTVEAGADCAARFELGPEEAAAPFEVRLEAHDWTLVTVRGKTWVAAARLVELESLPLMLASPLVPLLFPLLALHCARPGAAWALALPLVLLILARTLPRPPQVVVGTLELLRGLPAREGGDGRARARRQPWLLFSVLGLLLGVLAWLGPRGARGGTARSWTCVVDRSPALGFSSGASTSAGGGATTRLDVALESANSWLTGAGGPDDRVRWIAAGRTPLELARGELPPLAWLAPEPDESGEPEWALHDRPGVLWISDREPAVARVHAGLFASGGEAVHGAIAADGHTTWTWEGGELRAEAERRALAVRVEEPEGRGLPAVLERVLSAWCGARGFELVRTGAAETLLVLELVPARGAEEELVLERDGWRASARGARPDDGGSSLGDAAEDWLVGRTAAGAPRRVVRVVPGRIQVALHELAEPAGDPALFALSFARLFDRAARPPSGVVALAERQAAGRARTAPGEPAEVALGTGAELGPALDAALAFGALLCALAAYLLLPRARGLERGVRGQAERAAARHQ